MPGAYSFNYGQPSPPQTTGDVTVLNSTLLGITHLFVQLVEEVTGGEVNNYPFTWSNPDDPQSSNDNEPTTVISQELAQGLLDWLREGEFGGDPSVGIQPDSEALGYIEALQRHIDGKRYCPSCKGDGSVWAVLHDFPNGGERRQCMNCRGKGEVPLNV